MKKERLSVLALFAVALFWGFGYIEYEYAVAAGWNVFNVLFIRSIISFAILTIITWKHKIWKNKKLLKEGIIAGLFFFFGYVFQLYGQLLTNVTNCALITSCGIIFVPIISYLVFKKKPSTIAVIACVIGLCGSISLSYKVGFKFEIGDIITFLGAICFSFYYVWIERVANNHNAFDLTTLNFAVMGSLSLIAIPIFKEPFIGDLSNIKGTIGVLYYALVSGFAGFLLQTWAQKNIESSKASLILSLEGIIAAIIAIILFNEPVTINVILGGVLMTIATISSQVNPNKILLK